MTNLDNILKSRDITLSTKVCLVKAMVFPVVMYGCESWTIKKAEHQNINAFELWCWRILLRVPWTARRSSNHLILRHPLFLLPSIFPSIRVFSHESALCIRWPKYWSFIFIISPPMNTQDWSPLGWTGWISLQSKGLSRVFSNTTVQKHQFFGAQISLYSDSHIHTWPLEKP